MVSGTTLPEPYDGASARLYFNGRLVKTAKLDVPQPLATNTEPLLIGKGSNHDRLVGKLDDLVIYNRALDELEIQALFEACDSK